MFRLACVLRSKVRRTALIQLERGSCASSRPHAADSHRAPSCWVALQPSRSDWLQLLQAARHACHPAQDAPPTDSAAIAERKRHPACLKVKQRELSGARQVLTTCDLAAGTEATWAALTDPVRRPREPRSAIAQDVLHHPVSLCLCLWRLT